MDKLEKVKPAEVWVRLLCMLIVCLSIYILILRIRREHIIYWKRIIPIIFLIFYTVLLLFLTYHTIPVLYKARAFPPELYPFK